MSGSGALLTLLFLCSTRDAFGSSKCRAVQGWGAALDGHSQPGRSSGICIAKGEQWTLPVCSTWRDPGRLGPINEGGHEGSELTNELITIVPQSGAVVLGLCVLTRLSEYFQNQSIYHDALSLLLPLDKCIHFFLVFSLL